MFDRYIHEVDKSLKYFVQLEKNRFSIRDTF